MAKDAVDIGEAVLPVQTLHGMEVDHSLTAKQTCIALGVLIDRHTFALLVTLPRGEDIVVDVVGKE